MNKKNIILLCSMLGGLIGSYYGWAWTEVKVDPSPKVMNRPENREVFDFGTSSEEETAVPSSTERSYAEYADYLELCPEHYGAVVLLVSKDESGREILRLIGPQEEVDYIRTKTKTYADVHYCAELEY